MAHDHRMNPVGEPHLNKVNRGRSDLRRFRGMVTQQLLREHSHVNEYPDMQGSSVAPINNRSVIEPDLESAISKAVDARVTNYRDDRTAGLTQFQHNFVNNPNFKFTPGSEQTRLTRDTAREFDARFKNRQYFGEGDWA